MMCETCKYREYPINNDYKNNPCNLCIYWGDDGYKEYRNYVVDPELEGMRGPV
mgnify:CR=1 FL=1